MTPYLIKQLWAITPVYILNLCYGMCGGFPAITTPQLTAGCGLFDISREEESWIGIVNFNYLYPHVNKTLFSGSIWDLFHFGGNISAPNLK